MYNKSVLTTQLLTRERERGRERGRDRDEKEVKEKNERRAYEWIKY